METELKYLAKQCLSIVRTSNSKDDEIELWVEAGISDLKRQGIDAEGKIKDSLIQGAIIMFVKANFGNVDIKDKELAQKTYSLLCNNLGLSSEYKVGDNNA